MTSPILINSTRELVYQGSHLWGRFSRDTRKSFRTTSDSFFTFEEWADLPHCGCPFPVVLAQSQLHVEEGHPSDDEEQGVRDQEGTWGTWRQSMSPKTPSSFGPAPQSVWINVRQSCKGRHSSVTWPFLKGCLVVGTPGQLNKLS